MDFRLWAFFVFSSIIPGGYHTQKRCSVNGCWWEPLTEQDFFFCTLHLGLIIIVLSLISSYTVNCYPSFFLSLIGWVKSNLLIVAYRSSLIPINSMKLELTVLAFYYIIPSILSNYYGNYWNNIKLFKAILLK